MKYSKIDFRKVSKISIIVPELKRLMT